MIKTRVHQGTMIILNNIVSQIEELKEKYTMKWQ